MVTCTPEFSPGLPDVYDGVVTLPPDFKDKVIAMLPDLRTMSSLCLLSSVTALGFGDDVMSLPLGSKDALSPSFGQRCQARAQRPRYTCRVLG